MDDKDRMHLFLKEYGELVKKYGVDFAPYPVFLPSEKGEFKVVCQNMPVDLRAVKKDGFLSKD